MFKPLGPLTLLSYSEVPSPLASTCCPSRQGKKAQDATTKQVLKCHVEEHTGLLEGQVPGQRSDRQLPSHVSSLFPSPRPCCLRCHPALPKPSPSSWRDPHTPTRHTWTKFLPPTSPSGRTSRRRLKNLGPVAFWPPCQESLRTMTPRPEPTSCASQNLSSVVNARANKTANDPPMTCDVCANSVQREPEDTLWQKPRPNSNANEVLNPMTLPQTSTTGTISNEETSGPRPWRKKADFPRPAWPCSPEPPLSLTPRQSPMRCDTHNLVQKT